MPCPELLLLMQSKHCTPWPGVAPGLHSPWLLLLHPGIGRRNVRVVPQHSQDLLWESPGRGWCWSWPALLGWAVSAPLGGICRSWAWTSQSSGLYCYLWHPKSFTCNPDVRLHYCISAFDRFHSFHQTGPKILLKVLLIAKAIGASSLLPGVLHGSGKTPNYW